MKKYTNIESAQLCVSPPHLLSHLFLISSRLVSVEPPQADVHPGGKDQALGEDCLGLTGKRKLVHHGRGVCRLRRGQRQAAPAPPPPAAAEDGEKRQPGCYGRVLTAVILAQLAVVVVSILAQLAVGSCCFNIGSVSYSCCFNIGSLSYG